MSRYVGSAIDEAYPNYYWKFTDIKKIVHGGRDDKVTEYQSHRYYENNVSEMCEQIMAIRKGWA